MKTTYKQSFPIQEIKRRNWKITSFSLNKYTILQSHFSLFKQKNGIKRNEKAFHKKWKIELRNRKRSLFIPCPPSWDFFGLAYICTLTPRNPQEHRAFLPFFTSPKSPPIKYHKNLGLRFRKVFFSALALHVGISSDLRTFVRLRLEIRKSIGLIRFFALTTYQAT